MEDKKEAGLKFDLFDVSKIIFERGTTAKGYVYEINIENAVKIDPVDLTKFQVYFYISIGSKEQEKPLSMQVEAVGHFELFGDLTEDVIDNYHNISAPSIVYPYIRAFLSNLMLQSGLNPVNLPPINFATNHVVGGSNVEIIE
jgi:preprotein translocase subunit SecB